VVVNGDTRGQLLVNCAPVSVGPGAFACASAAARCVGRNVSVIHSSADGSSYASHAFEV
jgi:hypothetical protein